MTHERSTPAGGTYNLAIGRLLADFGDFWIGGAPIGYRARMRRDDGRLAGRELAALTLDELAVKMTEMRAGVEPAEALQVRPGARAAETPGTPPDSDAFQA